jgi:hypothetical protein
MLALTPADVPASIHFVLWPVLVVWALVLIRLRRSHPRLRSARLGFALVPASIIADGAALAAAEIWATPAARPLVFALLWLAVLLSVTTYLVLRAPGERGDGDGGAGDDGPEPPWWPEFERELRDYIRNGPRRPAGPRMPAGTSA